MMKRAVAYIRVSTDRQELSPEVQRAQVETYCQLKGYELEHVYEEIGVSGSVPFASRAEGAALLGLIEYADAVVFAKLDRAFRDTVDCIMTVERLRAAGKAVHFLDLGVDTTTPAGQLCLEMMAAFAKFERRRISERTREALSAARLQGKELGGVPLGYRSAAVVVDGRKMNAGVRTPVEAELAVVERIRSMRADGATLRAVAAALNDEGVPTLRGGRWAGETVRKIERRIADAAPSC